MFTSRLRRKRKNREVTVRPKGVLKLIDELRADMASKEDISQLNHELRADMASKEAMNQRIDEFIRTYSSQIEPSETRIWSIRNIFTASYLDGLRELADVNLNWILKTMWFLILSVNLVLLVFGMRPIVRDYLDEVIITRVHQIDTNFTQLNRPSICFRLFEDFLYLRSENGSSNNGLHLIDDQSLFYLGYIKAMMPLFASSGLWLSHIPSENLTWREFESLPARSSFSISHENVSLLSQNTLYDLLYSWGIGQSDYITSERSKFHYAAKLYSDILLRMNQSLVEYVSDSRICLPINLSQYSWIAANGKQLQGFIYEHYASAELKIPLLHEIVFSSRHHNAKTNGFMAAYPSSFMEATYRSKLDYIDYLVHPTKYLHLNLSRQSCYDAFGETYPRGFGETICFQDCLWNNHVNLFNCSFWEDLNSNEQQDIQRCHIFDILRQLRPNMSQICKTDQKRLRCNNKTMRSVKEWSRLLLDTYRELVIEKASSIGDCHSKCANFMFCEEWELQYELLYKHDTVEFIDNTAGPNLSAGLIASRAYTLSPFVSVNEDVLKALPQEFMSNLGGIIGLHFGASICGYLHLLLFLLISCCRKILKMPNKPRLGGRWANDGPIGKQ